VRLALTETFTEKGVSSAEWSSLTGGERCRWLNTVVGLAYNTYSISSLRPICVQIIAVRTALSFINVTMRLVGCTGPPQKRICLA